MEHQFKEHKYILIQNSSFNDHRLGVGFFLLGITNQKNALFWRGTCFRTNWNGAIKVTSIYLIISMYVVIWCFHIPTPAALLLFCQADQVMRWPALAGRPSVVRTCPFMWSNVTWGITPNPQPQLLYFWVFENNIHEYSVFVQNPCVVQLICRTFVQIIFSACKAFEKPETSRKNMKGNTVATSMTAVNCHSCVTPPLIIARQRSEEGWKLHCSVKIEIHSLLVGCFQK